MPQIRPIKDLQDITEISQICHASQEPMFFTQNGYGDLVVMSMKAYEEMMEINAIDRAITEAEAELAQGGKLYDAEEALEALRRKYFG